MKKKEFAADNKCRIVEVHILLFIFVFKSENCMAKSFGHATDLKIDKYLLSLSISFHRASQYCKVLVQMAASW